MFLGDCWWVSANFCCSYSERNPILFARSTIERRIWVLNIMLITLYCFFFISFNTVLILIIFQNFLIRKAADVTSHQVNNTISKIVFYRLWIVTNRDGCLTSDAAPGDPAPRTKLQLHPPANQSCIRPAADRQARQAVAGPFDPKTEVRGQVCRTSDQPATRCSRVRRSSPGGAQSRATGSGGRAGGSYKGLPAETEQYAHPASPAVGRRTETVNAGWNT